MRVKPIIKSTIEFYELTKPCMKLGGDNRPSDVQHLQYLSEQELQKPWAYSEQSMEAVRITQLNPKFNKSHFCLRMPPSSIHRMTGWLAISRLLWRMRTAPMEGDLTASYDTEQ